MTLVQRDIKLFKPCQYKLSIFYNRSFTSILMNSIYALKFIIRNCNICMAVKVC